MRVLVTGAAGRLGGPVIADLMAAGHAVRATDRARPTDGHVEGVPVEHADLTDPAAADGVVAGCDGVVHLAAYAGPDQAAGHEVFANNTRATYHVLAAAAGAGVRRVVIASSTAAYGPAFAPRPTSPLYVPVDEDHALLPQDPYALSRLVDEQTGAMFARAYGMTVVALRFHWIATPDQLRDRVAAVAQDPTYGWSVRELWGYVHVADAARACRAALDVNEGHHALNVVAPDSLSDIPTAALVARYHPDTTVRRLAGTASAWSSERARAVLGFAPARSWRDAP